MGCCIYECGVIYIALVGVCVVWGVGAILSLWGVGVY